MCASPGSKTAQLIENLYSGSTAIVPGIYIKYLIFQYIVFLLIQQIKKHYRWISCSE